MIPDPQNVFESLQNDVATKLMQTSPFSTIKWPDGSAFKVLTEDEGDPQFEFDAMIAQLGLCLIVKACEGDIEQPDIPGPLISKLGFDVWVSEAPLFNEADAGTKVRLFTATGIVLGTLHQFQPDSVGSPLYATKFRRERQRTYMNDQDKIGYSVKSNIISFIAPQSGAVIGQ